MTIGAEDARADERFRRRLFRRWVQWVTIGEFAGFCVPALTGTLVADLPVAVVLPALVASGFAEGAILGWSQARVLRTALPSLRVRAWILGTAIAAALAWFLGMLPSTTRDWWSTWPPFLSVVMAVVLGSALLCSIGVAQWLELRRHLPRALWWVGATALAWCVGLLVFIAVTTPLWSPGQTRAVVAAIGAGGGLAMAAAMASTTGWAIVRLLPSDAA